MFVKLTDYKFRQLKSSGQNYIIAHKPKIRARDGYAPEANCLMRQSRSGCCPDRALLIYFCDIIILTVGYAPLISSLKTRPTPVPYFGP